MKRGTKLAVLAAALAVCVGLYFLATALTKSKEAKAAETSSETIDLSAGAADSVTGLSWTYDGQTVTLEKDGDAWTCAEDASCPVDADIVTTMLSAVTGLSANGTVASPEALSEYGLDAPALTVTVTTADGQTTYRQGATNTLTGDYYLMKNEDETVYTVGTELEDNFARGLSALVKEETLPADISQVTGLTVETDGTATQLVYLADSSGVSFSSDYNWFETDNGAYTPLDTDSVTTLYGTITGLAWTSCVTWNATADELAEYGLTEPQGRVELDYTDSAGAAQSFTLLFGSYSGSDVYVQIEGSKMVYLAAGTVLDGFMHMELEPQTLCPVDWDTVTSMDITVNGQTVTVYKGTKTETATAETAQDGTAEQTESASTAAPETGTTEVTTWTTADGVSLDTDTITPWLEQIAALKSAGAADASQARTQELSVTFHRSSAVFSEITLELYTYDSTNSICVLNGERCALVDRSGAEDLAQDAAAFLNPQS